MDHEFHILSFRLDGMVSHLIWLTNDTDGVLLDKAGTIRAFSKLSEIQQFAADLGLMLLAQESGVNCFELDEITRWMELPTKAEISCELFLDCWNLFDDVAHSSQDSGFIQLSEQAVAVYDKLFWGCNLPAMTPPGERYIPAWSIEEVELLRLVFATGMAAFRRNLRVYS